MSHTLQQKPWLTVVGTMAKTRKIKTEIGKPIKTDFFKDKLKVHLLDFFQSLSNTSQLQLKAFWGVYLGRLLECFSSPVSTSDC